jgi:hypothetical protein
MIYEATGAPPQIAPTLERIMREDIFHSTLDWQTREEFDTGALEAHAQYQSAPAYYNSVTLLLKLVYQRMKAETRLENARKKGRPELIAKAEEHLKFCCWKEEHTGESVQTLGNFYFGPA